MQDTPHENRDSPSTRSTSASPRLVVGCMTGTSLDGLDAALVRIEGHGLDMRASFVEMVSLPLGDLREELRHFASGGAGEPLRYLRAARRLGELHASAVATLCEKSKIANPKSQISFVVAHGQTIWHAPDDPEARGGFRPPLPGGERDGVTGETTDAGKQPAKRSGSGFENTPTTPPASPSPPPSPPWGEGGGVSWQLFDPWPIVRRVGVPVCYDLRQADLIAGGQGAPITPISDWVMYRDKNRDRVIANLGGICNATCLHRNGDASKVFGGDAGPCNLLIDRVVQKLFPGLSYDEDGHIAKGATVHPLFSDWVFEAPFFKQHIAHSTGREEFNDAWIDSLLARARQYEWPLEDIVASATFAVARIVNRFISHAEDHFSDEYAPPAQLVLAGGGARNPILVELIQRTSRRTASDVPRITMSDELGIPSEAREAMGFAVLGALSQDGVPITLPRVTGATAPGRAGAWVYP